MVSFEAMKEALPPKPIKEDYPRKYVPPKGVVPAKKKSAIAMDSCFDNYMGGYSHLQFFSSFQGYQLLSSLAQSSDYRMVGETTANEMTRAWGKVVGGENPEKLAIIEAEMERLCVRDLFRQHIYNESVFGLSHLYIDVDSGEPNDVLIAENVKKGQLKRLLLIEPIHTTPSFYNANDPLAKDFYKVRDWFCLGKQVTQDRLLTLVMRPVPDMYKPAYNFGGLSMVQLMKPYVERWQRTVDSVSDLIKAFSITCLKTDMSAIISGGDIDGVNEFAKRLRMFGEVRENLNLMALDNTNEELVQINTPLSGLDSLVSKAQEQMSMPSHTPLVKLTGITPSGLNASSDGEIQVYYDWIMSLNKAHVLPQLMYLLKFIQMSLFEEIDPSITFEFDSLTQMTSKERSEIEMNKANSASVLISAGVISQEEARQSIKDDKDLDYHFIDVDDVPDVDNGYDV